MKELYVSPVLNVLCFAPVERLANFTFDQLWEVADGSGSGSGSGSGANPSHPASTDKEGDLGVNLGKK